VHFCMRVFSVVMSVALPIELRVVHPLSDGGVILLRLLDLTPEGKPVLQLCCPEETSGAAFNSFSELLYWLRIVHRNNTFPRDRWKLHDVPDALSYFIYITDLGEWVGLARMVAEQVKFERTEYGMELAQNARHTAAPFSPLEVDLKSRIGMAHLISGTTDAGAEAVQPLSADVSCSAFVQQAKLALARQVVATRVDALHHPVSSALQCPVDRFDMFLNRKFGSANYATGYENQHVDNTDEEWASLPSGAEADNMEYDDIVTPSNQQHYQAEFECTVAVPRARSFMRLLSCAFRWKNWMGRTPQWPNHGPCLISCPPWQQVAWADLLEWLKTEPWLASGDFQQELTGWLFRFQHASQINSWQSHVTT